MAQRPDRPVKRLRRLSTEHDDSEGTDDWIPQTNKRSQQSSAAPASSRPRRGVAHPIHSTTIHRTATTSPEETRPSIHLTVKAPPSKLREATSGSSRRAGVNSRDTFEGGEILSGPRGSRSKKTIVEESSEEEEDEDDDEIEQQDEDEEDDEDEEMEEEDDDIDAEGEDDVDMMDAPVIRPSVTVTLADGDLPSVETKEMVMDDDDEELSELESQDEDDEDDGAGDEDAEVEEAEEGDQDAEGEEDLESSDETPASMSRSHTPDLSKLTRRQRAAYQEYDGGLMALSNEAQKKKHLTAEEHAMRRAEMARRRKNLSEKRNEEEKMDTINRLLKKQAPKRRGRAKDPDLEAAQEDQEPDLFKPSPLFVRYISNIEGTRVGVPEEWLEAPVGSIFNRPLSSTASIRPLGSRMVEEVA